MIVDFKMKLSSFNIQPFCWSCYQVHCLPIILPRFLLEYTNEQDLDFLYMDFYCTAVTSKPINHFALSITCIEIHVKLCINKYTYQLDDPMS